MWGSSENWHLYYRLRQSYGDYRELIRAPGHMFLGHEAADLTTVAGEFFEPVRADT